MKEAVTPALGATVVEPVVVPVQPSEDLSELVGKRIGNYVIERHLGIGGMAVVFVARHPTLGREVAVKFLKPSLNNDPQMAERFLYEAKLTATLPHPNIVEILDFGEYERRPYYMMELLQGEDLGAKLRAGLRLSYREAVRVLEQICDALEAAHKSGVVHRDLKPDNIFIVEQDPLKVKVMDFGVAKASGDPRVGQTLHGQVLGTPTHMSPEQALGQVDRISPSTDLYALGVIGYQLLTGRLPFVADSAMMLISMHIRDPAPPILRFAPHVPPRIAEIVESCLAKDATRRPRSARVLASQLLTACKLAERTATVPMEVNASSPDLKVVEELALRLSRVEKPKRREAEEFAIPVPNPTPVHISEAPREGVVITEPPAKDAEVRFATFFSSVPAPSQAGDRGGGAPPVRTPPVPRDMAPEAMTLAKPSAGTSPTMLSPRAPAARDVKPEVRRGETEKLERSPEGDRNQPRGAPLTDLDTSETMLRGGVPREFQTGAAVLRVPPEALPPSAPGAVLGTLAEHPAPSSRGFLGKETGLGTSDDDGLSWPAASAKPTSARGFVAVDEPAVLLSEITDDAQTESVELSAADGPILERLLRRMQRRGDFPSFLSHMAEIVSKANADGQFSAAQLAEALRKDFGLTAKLLKVVNTAFMSRFKGRVYSVHQSIVILGFDSVRSIASGVLVYKVPGSDGQGKHKQVEGKYNLRLAESSINALVSGEIARLVTHAAKLRMDPEIAMMAAIFRNLGQHLVMQYLPEEFEKIEVLMQRERLSLPVASERVLGMPLRKLGCGVMARWQLPQILCDAVASQCRVDQPIERDIDRLGALARFATDLADLVARSGQASWTTNVQRLLERNRNLLAMDERQVGDLMATITKSFEERFAALVGPYCTKSRFFSNAKQLVEDAQPLTAPAAGAPGTAVREPALGETAIRKPALGEPALGEPALGERALGERVEPERNATDEEALSDFVQRLEDGLHKRHDPEKLAKRALQRVATQLKVPRVLLLGLSADKRQLEVRAGVGQEVDNIRQLLKLPLGQAGNLFASALSSNKPVVVDDALSSKVTKRVPQPYYEVIGSPCFILLPCCAPSYPGAVLLADVNVPEHLPTEEWVNATKSLRAVLAQLAHRSSGGQ